MSKKLKKNSFIEGTLIAYVAIVFTKLLGAFYSIPFKAIIGDEGGVIYACAYNIYSLFLSISTSGIPTAMSIIISEYIALNMLRTKEKAYRTGLAVISLFSFLSFLILFVFAKPIGSFLITNEAGGANPEDVMMAVRVVSICLLVVPFLSVKRGYLQGHKFISVSSYSQVIEQVVRVFVILAGSYLAVKVLNLGVAFGVSIALLGAFLGAGVALIYLSIITWRNRKELRPSGRHIRETVDTSREIIGKIVKFCIPIIIVSISTNIYDITDMKLVLTGLSSLGYTAQDSEVISSVIATWGPKICMIISSLAIGMTSSLVPHIVDSYEVHDYKGVNRKFNHAINTVLLITVPFAVAMILLSDPVYAAFYGESAYGSLILKFLTVINVLSSINLVASMSLQSMGKAFIVCSTSVIGLVINAALDLPLIYLMAALGFPAYIGASISSIIGQTVTLVIVLIFLRRDMRFRYRALGRLLYKIIVPTAAMALVVVLIRMVLPHYTSYITLLLSLAVYGIFGGAAYLGLTYCNGALYMIFGKDFIQKIIGRFRRS